MSATATYYYVCDACGSIVTITDAPLPDGETWGCDDCGHEAAWEFTDSQKAAEHAMHIKQIARDGRYRR